MQNLVLDLATHEMEHMYWVVEALIFCLKAQPLILDILGVLAPDRVWGLSGNGGLIFYGKIYIFTVYSFIVLE